MKRITLILIASMIGLLGPRALLAQTTSTNDPASPLTRATESRPHTVANDVGAVEFELTVEKIEIKSFQTTFELAYADGSLKRASKQLETLKKTSANTYAASVAAAKRLGVMDKLQRVRGSLLAIFNGGAPDAGETHAAWIARLNRLKAAYASAAGNLRAALEAVSEKG